MKNTDKKNVFTLAWQFARQTGLSFSPDLLPPTQHNRKSNDTVQVYFDTECHEYRCFKKFNLVSVA